MIFLGLLFLSFIILYVGNNIESAIERYTDRVLEALEEDRIEVD